MAGIAQYIQKIRTAIYGRDVRSSIADAIEECYSDVTNAKTLADSATTAANTAASNANAKATLADQKATAANSAATSANNAAAAANSAAGSVDAAKSAANTAATSANNAAAAANTAKTNADKATSAANTATSAANTARDNANAAATAANTAKTNADTATTAANTARDNANAAATAANAAKTSADAAATRANNAAALVEDLTVTTETVEPTDTADAVVTEESGHFNIHFEIPKGDKGDIAAVTNTTVQYQTSASGNTVPTGTWLDTQPTTPQGYYLWLKTTYAWNNGQTTTQYSCSRMGMDGSGSVVSVAGVSPDLNGDVPVTAADVPMSSSDTTTISQAIAGVSQSVNNLAADTIPMSSSDSTTVGQAIAGISQTIKADSIAMSDSDTTTISEALDDLAATIPVVDSAMSETSENPVQNRAIKAEIDALASRIGSVESPAQTAISITFTIPVSAWTGSAGNYTATINSSSITANSLVLTPNISSGFDYLQSAWSWVQVTGGVTFTVASIPSGAIGGTIPVVDSVNGIVPVARGGTGVGTLAEAKSAFGISALETSVSNMNSSIGTVPSGQTVQGQISALNSNIASLQTTRIVSDRSISSGESLMSLVSSLLGTGGELHGLILYTCSGTLATDIPSTIDTIPVSSYGQGWIEANAYYHTAYYRDTNGNVFTAVKTHSGTSWNWTAIIPKSRLALTYSCATAAEIPTVAELNTFFTDNAPLEGSIIINFVYGGTIRSTLYYCAASAAYGAGIMVSYYSSSWYKVRVSNKVATITAM